MKAKRLSKKLKKEWIKALRSGEYKQCTGKLHNGVGFCCLGVLADINEDAYWVLPEYSGCRWSIDGAADNMYGEHIIGDNANVLAKMNDRGELFNDIADWIEENL